MSAKTIKSALGLLQDDPDHAKAWQELRDEVGRDPGMTPEELGKLLEAARRAHEGRRETRPSGRMLAIEASVASGYAARGRAGRRAGARARRGAARRRGGTRGLRAAARAAPGRHATRPRRIERADAKRGKWRDLVERYVQEAQGGGRPGVPQLAARERRGGDLPLRPRRRRRSVGERIVRSCCARR